MAHKAWYYMSAYALAVKHGYTGTEEQWLADLKGEQGVQGETGPAGDSAYALAVKYGYEGTEAQWVAAVEAQRLAAAASASQAATEKTAAASSAAAALTHSNDAAASAAQAAASATAAQVMAATPKVVTSTSAMTGTEGLYVLVDDQSEYDGYFYYYDSTQEAWAPGGAYNAAAVNTDTALTTSGAAADAKAAGDGIRGVQKTVAALTVGIQGSSDTFEGGAVNTSTGANATSNANIRSKTVLPSSCYAVECASGWSAAYYAYNGTTYVGCWDKSTGTFTTTRTFNSGLVYLSNISETYTIRIVIKKNAGGNIDVATAAPNITLWSRTDTGLTKSGAIADAKAAGDRISALESDALQSRWEAARSMGDNLLDNNYIKTGKYISSGGPTTPGSAASGMSNLIPVRGGVAYNYDMESASVFGSNGKYAVFYPMSVKESDDVTQNYTVKTATTIATNQVFQIIPSEDGYIRINRRNSWKEQWFGAAPAVATASSKTEAPGSGEPTAYVYTGTTEESSPYWVNGHEYVWVVDAEDSSNNAWTDMGAYVYKTNRRSFIHSPGASIDAVLNPLFGKKLACEGASIMAGNESYRGGYAKMVALDNDMELVNNAVGGGTVATGTYSSGSTARHWVSGSIESLPEGYDYYIFDGAANDIDVHVPFGTPVDVDYYGDYNLQTGTRDTAALLASLDRTTFSGAFEYCCIVLATKYGAAKHGYIIPHRKRAGAKQVHSACGGAVDPDLHYPTWRTTWLDLWKPFIKATLAKWGIACLDLEEIVPPLGLIDSLKSAYTVDGDGTHPTEDAYRLFYKGAVEAWLRTL